MALFQSRENSKNRAFHKLMVLKVAVSKCLENYWINIVFASRVICQGMVCPLHWPTWSFVFLRLLLAVCFNNYKKKPKKNSSEVTTPNPDRVPTWTPWPSLMLNVYWIGNMYTTLTSKFIFVLDHLPKKLWMFLTFALKSPCNRW